MYAGKKNNVTAHPPKGIDEVRKARATCSNSASRPTHSSTKQRHVRKPTEGMRPMHCAPATVLAAAKLLGHVHCSEDMCSHYAPVKSCMSVVMGHPQVGRGVDLRCNAQGTMEFEQAASSSRLDQCLLAGAYFQLLPCQCTLKNISTTDGASSFVAFVALCERH